MLKRIHTDISNLIRLNKDTKVDGMVLIVPVKGPKDSYYENGSWLVRIEMSEQYPYKSPSVGFLNKIYHPNIDLNSGSICLNVLNQTWTPIYNLCHIVETFIPQLLQYPNPNDPLNEDAAKIFINNKEQFKKNVDKYILYGHK